MSKKVTANNVLTKTSSKKKIIQVDDNNVKKDDIVIHVIDDFTQDGLIQKNKFLEEELIKLKHELDTLQKNQTKTTKSVKPVKPAKSAKSTKSTNAKNVLIIKKNLKENFEEDNFEEDNFEEDNFEDNLEDNSNCIKIKLKEDNSKTILSRNGYRFNKNKFPIDTINVIKKELTLIPFAREDINDAEPYLVYRETPTELIVPRYYAMNKFGSPEKNILKEDKINIQFTGELRDFQINIVEKCLNHLKEFGGGILTVPCGRGKCLAKGTQVIMYDGTIKLIENVKIGEYLMGDDSTARTVLSLGYGREEMFDIISHQSKYTVNRSHILSLKYINNKCDIINGKKYKNGDVVDISIEDYLKLPEAYHSDNSPLMGFRVPIDFPKKNISEDPYLLGYKIGKNNLLNKQEHIPYAYKCNTKNIRIKLFAGLLDSIGTIRNDGCAYQINHITNDELKNDIIYMCRSLGFTCDESHYKSLCIYGKDLNIIPVKIINKISNYNDDHLVYKINIKSVGVGEYYGIELNSNKRYLLGDFTVTHNTVMAIKMLSELRLKTLVVVHKTFLLDQWMERITQFTNARIGIIKQNKVTVKDCDIIVGMIQSISMKDYDPKIFNDIGCVIYDECHHTASRVFSNALYKTCSKYTIGLSATPKRTDGLEKITNWYLGNSMYSETMRINKQVVAKIIFYKSNDKLFREKKAWMKGRGMTPSTTKMLNNLCCISERTKHIVDIINEIRKDPERKILILSERKAHLVDMKALVDQSIADDIKNQIIDENEIKTYMYTGDSKRTERKDAETLGDILFATFQLAHEGLDIERLNTIILATPKKNIIQSVGRIMRKLLKSGDIRPLIIDFSDVLSVYKNQSSIREINYKSNKYKIEHYYVKNNKVITFDDYMKQEENYTQEEILEMPKRIIYDATWKSVLDVTRVVDNPEDLISINKCLGDGSDCIDDFNDPIDPIDPIDPNDPNDPNDLININDIDDPNDLNEPNEQNEQNDLNEPNDLNDLNDVDNVDDADDTDGFHSNHKKKKINGMKKIIVKGITKKEMNETYLF